MATISIERKFSINSQDATILNNSKPTQKFEDALSKKDMIMSKKNKGSLVESWLKSKV